MDELDLIATCAFGLEAVVKRELNALGYEARTLQPGRIVFTAEPSAICRANLHLRCAERVLICVGRFNAPDFDALFDQTSALPWHEWIPSEGSFPVSGKSIKSQLSSVPACQRAVKRAIVDALKARHGVGELPESGARYAVEVALLDDVATLTIDTTGEGLHKRGYRPHAGKAPLRETLAAALVSLSFWKANRPLIDPFCGSGTIAIEAAMLGRNIAPGLRRTFVGETWPWLDNNLWQATREEAKDLIAPNLDERIMGTDISSRDLMLAREHAAAVGVEDDIHFQERPFAELTSKREYGCVICNPPYGRRIGEQREVEELYRSFPRVLRRLPTWSHFVLTAHPDFERAIGQRADRRRKLYNGRIECQYFQFHGPEPSKTKPSDTPKVQVFGGLDSTADRQAAEFRSRLTKRARHLRRWPGRGITCYRLYERDVPEVPLVVDRYEDRLHIAEFDRPHDRTPAQHADWLDLMKKTAGEVMEIHPSNIFMKFRDHQRGTSQYERRGSDGHEFVVTEGGLRFKVNLSDYLDTGLFLDHRITRQMVRDQAANKRVLNLFAYTGSFTVYAAAGGAKTTTTVDSTPTYLDWAKENLLLNELHDRRHRGIESDVVDYLKGLDRDVQYDLAIVDPPTFSNSKDIGHDWDVQRDYAQLLNRVGQHISSGGAIYFSTNFRRFKFDETRLDGMKCHEISKQTVPPDFRNRRIHRCWRIVAD